MKHRIIFALGVLIVATIAFFIGGLCGDMQQQSHSAYALKKTGLPSEYAPVYELHGFTGSRDSFMQTEFLVQYEADRESLLSEIKRTKNWYWQPVSATQYQRFQSAYMWDFAKVLSIPGPEYFEELFRVSRNQIIWGGNYFLDYLPPTSCFVCWDTARRDMDFADGELAWTSFKKPMRVVSLKWGGNELNPKLREERIHPTQKPVRLYEYLIARFAEPGDKILDTHVGSASSLIACYRTGHEYWGFEIDPVFYKDASERLENAKAQISMFDENNSLL